MKSLTKAAMVALASAALLVGANADAFAGGRHHGRGVAIGLGLLGAAAVAAAASRSARAAEYDDDYASPRQCRRWDRFCDDGERWACRKVRRHCY